MAVMLFKGLVFWPCRRCTAWVSPILQWQLKRGTGTCWENDEISEWSWRNYCPSANQCKESESCI